MDFSTNKTPNKVIKKGVNGKWYRKSWKAFDQLKNIDQTYYCSNYYDVSAKWNINKILGK